MRNLWAILFALLLAAVPLCALGNETGPVTPPGHARGQKSGGYTLKVVGAYSGLGTSSVTSTSVSITIQLKAPNGCECDVSFNDMPLLHDRFQGTAPFNGTTLAISGRVDMPAGTDADQTPTQAITGRVTATFTDTDGNGGRLVAIQDEASRGFANTSP